MTIIAETGLIVANANSYVTLAEGRALAAEMGFALPVADLAAENALKAATGYLEGLSGMYQGHSANSFEQPLQWPRILVFIEGTEFPSDMIPKALKKAQVSAAFELAENQVDLYQAAESNVKRRKTDVLETEYFASKITTAIAFPRVAANLRPLLIQSTNYGLPDRFRG